MLPIRPDLNSDSLLLMVTRPDLNSDSVTNGDSTLGVHRKITYSLKMNSDYQ